MAGIVVVGNISVRLVVSVPHLPAAGESIQGGPLRSFPGGKGANQAVAAARAGARVRLIGRVGEDEFGRVNLNALTGHGIDVSGVIRDPSLGTGIAFVAVDDDGDFLLVASPGANQTLSRNHVRSVEFSDPDIVLGVLEVQTDAVIEAFRIAREGHAATVLSAESADDVSAELLERTDYLIANRIQASVLTGIDVVDEATGRRAASALKPRVSGAAIVTLGKLGAVVDLGDGPLTVGSFSVEARDNSIAGDAFTGAFCADLSKRRSPIQALVFASAAAAISVSRPGGQSSLPTGDEITAMVEGQSR